MKLQDLLLTDEEISLLDHTRFIVPIHPSLLEAELPKDLAMDVLPTVAQTWYEQLSDYLSRFDESGQQWIKEVFLSNSPQIEGKKVTLLRGGFRPEIRTGERGFAHVLNLNMETSSLAYTGRRSEAGIYPPFVNFSPEKFEAYALRTSGPVTIAATYGQFNVDNLPQALFLRVWAMTYLNEALTLTSQVE